MARMTKCKKMRPSFFKVLIGDFTNQLRIPPAFVKNFNGSSICSKSTLKSPSGKCWVVNMVENVEGLFFIGNGWHQFMKDHSLEYGDFLVFKYNGRSDFSVKIYDKTACEKLVITEPSNMNNNNEIQNQKQEYEHEIRKADCVSKVINNSNKAVIDGMTSVGQPFETLSQMVEHYASSSRSTTRRPVTLAEKNNAFKLAQATSTTESIIVVMKPTHVYRKFYVHIPKAWTTKYMTMETQDVILRLKDKLWNTKYWFGKCRPSGGLSGGWKNFVEDNKLDEFDVCVFTPARLSTKPVVLDVSIFRVVNDVVSRPAS